MPRPPGPSLPAMLQLGWFVSRPVHFLETLQRRYGDMITTRSPIFGHEILISRPDVVREVFRGDPDVFCAGQSNSVLATLVGKQSVLVLDGAPHRRERKLLMPPFHGERMRAYADVMRSQTLNAIAAWPDREPIALQPVMQRITLEIILRTVFGMDEDGALAELRAALDLTLVGPTSPIGMLPLIPGLQRDLGPLWPWGKFVSQLAATDALIHRQIHQARQRDRSDRGDILSMLLSAVDEDGQRMTDDELRDELMTLLVAGHETTATALCWAFEMILLHSSVRARVMDELYQVVSGDQLDAAHISQLPYLDAVIKESMRLRPIIPSVGRKVQRDIELGGYSIKAGDTLAPCAWLLHRNPESYFEPERFLPERFLNNKPDPYAWMPFGGGVRRCIGMAFAIFEMKVVLATVLTQRHLRLARRRPSPIVLRGFTFSPKGGTVVVPSPPATHRRRPS